MPRRRQKAAAELRRARKEVSQWLGRKQGSYAAPARSDCTHRTFYMSADEAGLARIEVRLWRQAGQVVDFHLALQLMLWDSWVWQTCFRVDIRHGHAHAHRVVDGEDIEGDPQHIHRLDSLEDVDEGYRRSVEHLLDIAAIVTRQQNGDHDVPS